MGAAENDYQLGHEISERHRLGLQGRVLAPATRTLLQAAGIKARMRVLDLGSGVGDAAFVAAEMVGPSGEVVGVERSAEAVGEATARTRQAGLSNAYFVQGDIYDPAPNGPFDAVICRLVLMYVADPATVLRTQSALVSPGGVVAPIEFDVLTGRSVPSTPLVQQANGWIAEAFTRGGIHPALGPKLWSVLVDAGLQPVGMLGVQPHCGPETAEGPALLAGIVRTCLPLIERCGVATAEQVGPETLEARLADELVAHHAVWAHPTLFSAWARIEAAVMDL